jgi:betaine-aldehyde dehydrogenase
MKLAEQKLYIGGRYVDASSGETFDTVNPATGEIICKVQKANAIDVDNAVASSRGGFECWSRQTGTQRSRILMQAVALLRQRNRELADSRTVTPAQP